MRAELRPPKRASLLAIVAFAAALPFGTASAQVVINEVHYNPAGDDATVQLEFVELYNAGPAAVDLSAWKLSFGPEPLVFPLGTTLPSHAYLVAAEKISSLQAATGATAQFEWQGLDTGLGNGGDEVTLLDASSAVIDVVSFDDDPPWPTTPDGGGPSLELLNPALNNWSAASWRASVGTNGTPGAQNSVFSLAPTIQSETPRRLSSVETLPSVSVTFTVPVTGVLAGNLTVNGSAATSLTGSGAGPYVFSGYAAPAPGSATIALGSGGIQAGGVPFSGATWTESVGLVVVINEIHYHPAGVTDDAEFLELYNAGASTADLGGWTISDGLDMTFPPGTSLAAGTYLVAALNPAVLQSATGYASAIAWTSGRLANEGERLALSDSHGNEIDVVSYADGGSWPVASDGDGPSLELIHPRLPNEYGPAWKASVSSNGTPGAANGAYDATPAPIIFGTKNAPVIPLPSQSVTITATILDESTVPTATLYYRRDAAPTIAYASTSMLDDGLHGDGAAGDRVYGAIVPGLLDGERLDFTIRASDGSEISAGPPGNNTLAAGDNPAQTYLCEFSATPPAADLPAYRLITTQHTRDLQESHVEDEHDATFVRCGPGGCEIFYNVVERYRGSSSLGEHPHSFRVDFNSDQKIHSEMGFDITKLDLLAQCVFKQHLGYQFFREAFGRSLPVAKTQLVRLHTNPLSHGGTQEWVYNNAERLDEDFLSSQDDAITPARFPSLCSGSATPCESDADCAPSGTCVRRDTGNLYRGRYPNSTFQYLGPGKEDGYRFAPYDKETNVDADWWDDLIDTCRRLDADTTPDASFEPDVKASVDEDEWARWFAIHMLLVNQEGGIYRDTGDDYFVYFEPPGSPLGFNAKMVVWDQDSVFGGDCDVYNQESIWRTTVVNPQRFLRSNAFAGKFVGAICELLDTDFSTAVMDARIDALPAGAADATRKQALKDFVRARQTSARAEITRTLTVNGVPASPYTNPNPVIAISGTLNQCGTHHVTVNGVAVPSLSVYGATWSGSFTLTRGLNTITVRDVDAGGTVLDTVTKTVVFSPPCSTNAECGDGDACNGVETCDTGTAQCVPGTPLTCGDGNACNGVETCDASLGCQSGAPLACSDGNVCNGVETCDTVLGCQAGAPLACGDGNVCNGTETCDTVLGCQAGAPLTCNDGNVCNGVETCNTVLGCQAGAPLACGDGNVCNGVETCDTVLGCLPGTPPAAVTISVPDDARAVSGGDFVLPIVATPAIGVGVDITLQFDPAVLDVVTVQTTILTTGASLLWNESMPGKLLVSMFSTAPLSGSGPIANVTLHVVGGANASSGLDLTRGVINEGQVSTCLDDGAFAECHVAPPEVVGVVVGKAGSTSVSFASAGTGARYDVASGLLRDLRQDAGVVDAVCVVNDAPGTTVSDPRPDPAPGDGFYYIVRAQDFCGAGTYGYATGGAEHVPAAACP